MEKEGKTTTQLAINTRPITITIIASIHICAGIFSLIKNILSPDYHFGPWYPAYFNVGIVLLTASMIGLWKMKKWGFYLFMVTSLFSQIFLVYKGIWAAWMVILPAAIIGICSVYYKKMD